MSKDRYEEFISMNFQALKDDFIADHQDKFNEWLNEEYINYVSSYDDLVYDAMKDEEFLKNYEDTAK